jgi:hypothetical protein
MPLKNDFISILQEIIREPVGPYEGDHGEIRVIPPFTGSQTYYSI